MPTAVQKVHLQFKQAINQKRIIEESRIIYKNQQPFQTFLKVESLSYKPAAQYQTKDQAVEYQDTDVLSTDQNYFEGALRPSVLINSHTTTTKKKPNNRSFDLQGGSFMLLRNSYQKPLNQTFYDSKAPQSNKNGTQQLSNSNLNSGKGRVQTANSSANTRLNIKHLSPSSRNGPTHQAFQINPESTKFAYGYVTQDFKKRDMMTSPALGNEKTSRRQNIILNNIDQSNGPLTTEEPDLDIQQDRGSFNFQNAAENVSIVNLIDTPLSPKLEHSTFSSLQNSPVKHHKYKRN